MRKNQLQKAVKDRMINGVRYALQESHEVKGRAITAAKEYRRKGRPARVIKRKDVLGRTLYSVFVHFHEFYR